MAYVFAYIDRQILSLLIQPIKKNLVLSDSEFGLLSGLAFAIFYAAMGIPIASLSDSRSRTKIIAAGLLVWSAATVACGLARSFAQLFLARIAVGAGEACISPASYSLIADLFPKDRLGRALAVYSTGSFLGSGLAFLVGGWVVGAVTGQVHSTVPMLSQLASWQLAFVIAGLPGILLALLIPIAMKDPYRSARQQPRETRAKLGEVISLMRNGGAVFPCLFFGYSLCAMSLFSLMAWAPAYLMRTFSLDARTSGYWLGTVVLVACTGGVLVSGTLVDLLRRRGRVESPFLTGIIGAAGVGGAFFATFALPSSTTAMQLVTPANMRARVSAIFLFCNSMIGLALGAFLVGVLNDHVFAAIGRSLTTVVAGASVFAVIILAAGTPALRRALEPRSELA
jgi:MFS family permease